MYACGTHRDLWIHFAAAATTKQVERVRTESVGVPPHAVNYSSLEQDSAAIEKAFNQIDVNNDGVITRAEWLAASGSAVEAGIPLQCSSTASESAPQDMQVPCRAVPCRAVPIPCCALSSAACPQSVAVLMQQSAGGVLQGLVWSLEAEKLQIQQQSDSAQAQIASLK